MSLMRASAVVKRQSIVACSALRSCVQANVSATSVLRSGMRRSRQLTAQDTQFGFRQAAYYTPGRRDAPPGHRPTCADAVGATDAASTEHHSDIRARTPFERRGLA